MLCMFSLLWPRLALLCLRKQPLPIHIHWCVCLLPPHGPGCLLSEGRDSGCFGHCYLSSTPGTKWSLTDWLNTWMKLFYARGNQGLVRWCHLPPPPQRTVELGLEANPIPLSALITVQHPVISFPFLELCYFTDVICMESCSIYLL